MPGPYAPSAPVRHMRRPGWKRASYWAFALLVAPTLATVASELANEGDTSALLLSLPAVGTIVLGIVLRRRALEIALAALLSIPAACLAWFAWFLWNFPSEWTIPISPPIAPFMF